jgi:hypothetical protein
MPWDGLEIYYSEHSPKQIRFFEEIAKNKNWLSTGGSDYHGEYGKHADRLGKYGLNEEQYKLLTSGVEARRAERSGKEI